MSSIKDFLEKNRKLENEPDGLMAYLSEFIELANNFKSLSSEQKVSIIRAKIKVSGGARQSKEVNTEDSFKDWIPVLEETHQLLIEASQVVLNASLDLFGGSESSSDEEEFKDLLRSVVKVSFPFIQPNFQWFQNRESAHAKFELDEFFNCLGFSLTPVIISEDNILSISKNILRVFSSSFQYVGSGDRLLCKVYSEHVSLEDLSKLYKNDIKSFEFCIDTSKWKNQSIDFNSILPGCRLNLDSVDGVIIITDKRAPNRNNELLYEPLIKPENDKFELVEIDSLPLDGSFILKNGSIGTLTVNSINRSTMPKDIKESYRSRPNKLVNVHIDKLIVNCNLDSFIFNRCYIGEIVINQNNLTLSQAFADCTIGSLSGDGIETLKFGSRAFVNCYPPDGTDLDSSDFVSSPIEKLSKDRVYPDAFVDSEELLAPTARMVLKRVRAAYKSKNHGISSRLNR